MVLVDVATIGLCVGKVDVYEHRLHCTSTTADMVGQLLMNMV
jgi:hypothetical protein